MESHFSHPFVQHTSDKLVEEEDKFVLGRRREGHTNEFQGLFLGYFKDVEV